MFKLTFFTAILGLTAACVGSGGPTTTKFSGSLSGCPNYTGISAEYARSAPGLPVRCGPQSDLPVTYR